MATIDDAIYSVIQGSASADEKIKMIKELRKALPTDRWSTRYVIWGLIFVVTVPIIGLTISFTWHVLNVDITKDLQNTFDVAKLLPQGLVSLSSTAIGALAAYITTARNQSAPEHATGQQPTGQQPTGQQPTGQQPTGQQPAERRANDEPRLPQQSG